MGAAQGHQFGEPLAPPLKSEAASRLSSPPYKLLASTMLLMSILTTPSEQGAFVGPERADTLPEGGNQASLRNCSLVRGAPRCQPPSLDGVNRSTPPVTPPPPSPSQTSHPKASSSRAR